MRLPEDVRGDLAEVEQRHHRHDVGERLLARPALDGLGLARMADDVAQDHVPRLVGDDVEVLAQRGDAPAAAEDAALDVAGARVRRAGDDVRDDLQPRERAAEVPADRPPGC